MSSEQRVRVLGLGLDARFRNMLDVFFIRSCDGRYQLAVDAADVVVVDMDAVGARDAYAEHRQSNTNVPTILFSSNEEQYKTRDNVVLLRKPFTVRQLQSAFGIVSLYNINMRRGRRSLSRPATEKIPDTRVKTTLGHEKYDQEQKPALTVINSRDGFSLSRHDEYVKLNSLLPGMISGNVQDEQTYQPGLYLQGELKLACEQAREAGKNARIALGGATITIDPEQGLAQMGMGKFQLREVSSFPLNHKNFKISLVPANKPRIENDGASTVLRLSELIWQTSLYAAQGRVPEGVDMDMPVQLERQPELTRLMLTSEAVRISTAWVAQAESVNQLANQLALSVRDVASFYSAAHALDLFLS
jgi:hypothetical protein